MKRDPLALANQRFDVLVIGAGITGAWIALDCARRGLSVALIDRGDIGAATSSRSSKLLHGGIRYLQQMQLHRVRESARERVIWHRVAPHLSHFVPFLVPTYRSIRQGQMAMRAGLHLYRALCAGENRGIRDPAKKVPPVAALSRSEVMSRVPSIDPAVTGGVVFYESHMENSERMTLAVAASAAKAGAAVANYVRADSFLAEGSRIAGVNARDLENDISFPLLAGVTVNAAGPWIGELESNIAQPGTASLTTGFSQGSHIVTSSLAADLALALPTSQRSQTVLDRGGRHVFIIPWRGLSLIGTSYASAVNGIDEPVMSSHEIDQLLHSVNAALPGVRLTREDVRHAFTGIYPLQEAEIRAAVYQGTGDYQLIEHGVHDGRMGLITALGAKFTTARRLAEKAADAVVRQIGSGSTPCRTADQPLAGGEINDLAGFRDRTISSIRDCFDPEQAGRLIRQYGTAVAAIAEAVRADSALGEPIGEDRPNVRAELIHAVREEMAIHLDDFVMRRTGIGTIGIPSRRYLTRCARLMAQELGWSQQQAGLEVEKVERFRFGAAP